MDPYHFCPGCGTQLTFYSRYPWYFCPDCAAKAEDAAGRSLIFGNVSFSGGLSWSYADSPGSYDDHIHVVCLVRKRPVIVTEARFGGIVMQPVDEGFTYGKRPGGIDLTQEHLPHDWYTYVLTEGVEEGRPGIYEWRIDGVGSYIGKSTQISNVATRYASNVANLLSGKPYRPSNPNGFRRIHKALAQSVREGRQITLFVLENVSVADFDQRTRELIDERGTLND